MRAFFATWSVVLVAACSGNEFSSSPSGLGGGGVDGSGGGTSSGGAANGSTDAGSSAAGGHVASGGSGASSGGSVSAGGGTSAGGAAAGGASSGGAGGAAAGGRASGGTSGGSAGGAITVLDAGPPLLAACPPSAPDSPLPCAGSFTCSYGNDPRVSCRSVYACQNGTFSLSLAVKCAAPKNCYGDFVTSGPLPVVGGACSPLGDFCAWDSGLACSCTQCSNGTTCSMGGGSWSCAPAASSPCPTLPPNEGQACDPNVVSDCQYGACGIASYVQARCKNRVWTWTFPTCN